MPSEIGKQTRIKNKSANAGRSSAPEHLDKLTIRRPERARLSPEENRARMESFATEREEAFIAAIREDED